MKITPLGHTEFVVDIENREGVNVRILVDTGLSDYVIGDLMERTVKVRLDASKLSSIDGIYISHAHTDHIDPYTLLQIYMYASPVLFLPETLTYLIPLFHEYIPSAEIRILKNKSTVTWKGIDIAAIALENEDITNEDDVMMLSLSNDKELLFAEIDALPPDTEEAQKYLYRHFTRKNYESVCYLASRNELEGNLKLLDKSSTDRQKWKNEYLHTRKEEIAWGYEKWEYEEYSSLPNIFEIPGFMRGFIGQGLCYPGYVSEELAGVSIFSLDEVVDREVSLAKESGFEFPQKALISGKIYEISKGGFINARKECILGSLELSYTRTPIEQGGVRNYVESSLSLPRAWDNNYLEKIENILNHRFLPYWSASHTASLRSALYKNKEGVYRIAFKQEAGETLIYEFSFASISFERISYSESLSIDEEYWLDDILDFLEGKQELYSSFWHRLDPDKIYRLWVCLGANWMNNDLIYKKYALHFDRAKAGYTPEDWMNEMLARI